LAPSSADAADRPDFSGSWKLNTATSRIKDAKLTAELAKLTIAQKDASIALAEAGRPSNVRLPVRSVRQMERKSHSGLTA